MMQMTKLTLTQRHSENVNLNATQREEPSNAPPAVRPGGAERTSRGAEPGHGEQGPWTDARRRATDQT